MQNDTNIRLIHLYQEDIRFALLGAFYIWMTLKW